MSCGQQVKKDLKINFSNVDSIIIYNTFPDDTIAPPPKKLSDKKAKQFVDDFNNSVSVGQCKYFAYFHLTVYQKDKSERQFRANDKSIKEKTDDCFDIGEKNYFDKLWDESK